MTEITNQAGYPTYDIMVDIDDVIVPWFETVDQKCMDLGLHDGSKVCDIWEMWEFYGCTKSQWLEAVEHAVRDGLYTSLPPLPGAVEAVNRLRWYGHRVHVVTARGFMANGENIRRWTRAYLDDFGIGYDTLTFTKDKVGAMDTLGVRFDMAVDDGVHNYEALQRAGIPIYLHDAPHNRGYRAERRVPSLWEFSNLVMDIARDVTMRRFEAVV